MGVVGVSQTITKHLPNGSCLGSCLGSGMQTLLFYKELGPSGSSIGVQPWGRQEAFTAGVRWSVNRSLALNGTSQESGLNSTRVRRVRRTDTPAACWICLDLRIFGPWGAPVALQFADILLHLLLHPAARLLLPCEARLRQWID